MNRLLHLVFASVLLFSTSFVELPRGSGYRIRTIVIDAGHGGHDSGCLGSSAKEKHIALAIALKVGNMIEEKYPDVRVIYTRKTDVFIPLFERAEIANRNKADLFICIHCNSGGRAAYGVETYVMGLHKTEDNLNVAKRENSAILLEDNYKKQYDGFDPNSPEANIIFSLYQNQFMNQSLSFAAKVQNQVDEFGGRYNRGVKQAGFLVLYRTAMPSVLIETGFLSNAEEEKYLRTEKAQTTLATSIFRAFREYKLDMEDIGNTESEAGINMDGKSNDTNPKPEINKTSEKEKVIEADTASKEKRIDQVKSIIKDKEQNPNSDTISLLKSEEKIKEQTSLQGSSSSNSGLDRFPVPEAKASKLNTDKKPNINLKNNPKNKVYFAVQIGASGNAARDLPKYLHINDVHSVKGPDGFVRFLAGNFVSLDDARNRLEQLKADGYKDAFITAYNGDQRITVNEASELVK